MINDDLDAMEKDGLLELAQAESLPPMRGGIRRASADVIRKALRQHRVAKSAMRALMARPSVSAAMPDQVGPTHGVATAAPAAEGPTVEGASSASFSDKMTNLMWSRTQLEMDVRRHTRQQLRAKAAMLQLPWYWKRPDPEIRDMILAHILKVCADLEAAGHLFEDVGRAFAKDRVWQQCVDRRDPYMPPDPEEPHEDAPSRLHQVILQIQDFFSESGRYPEASTKLTADRDLSEQWEHRLCLATRQAQRTRARLPLAQQRFWETLPLWSWTLQAW